MAIIKHVPIKNADYSKALEYLLFEHAANGKPVRNENGNLIMRDGVLIDGINCGAFSFDKECEMTNWQFHKNQGRNDVKAHHYILSFDPQDSQDGNLDAERAHALGMEFASRFFPGHQVLVCTHTDGTNGSGNHHVHIVLNSVRKLDVERQPFMEREIDCCAGYKHHATKAFTRFLKAEVMKMCERERLHQVDLLTPARNRITDREYRGQKRGQEKLDSLNRQIIAAQMKPRDTVFQTQKQYLRDAITAASAKASSLDEFRKILIEEYGINLKDHRGRFSYLHPDRKKHITGRALGSDYEKDHLLEILKKNAKGKEEREADQNDRPMTEYDPTYDYHADPIAILYIRSELRLVVDLQNNIKAQQSEAYARKVRLSNLQEMARTVVYIQEQGIGSREELRARQEEASVKVHTAEASLQDTMEQIRNINAQIHFTGQYYANKKIQSGFLKARNKKKYRAEHEKELDLYNDAVRYFKENAGGTIPSIKDLKAEKEKLSSLRERQKEEINSLRQYEKELQIAVTNVDAILGTDQSRSSEEPQKVPPAQDQKHPEAVRRPRREPSL